MKKIINAFKITQICFLCCVMFLSACQSDTKTAQETTAPPQKKAVKQQQKPRVPSPYWTAARKDIPLNNAQESEVKFIQNKYKKEINQLKKQKKWNIKERTRIEGERAKEMKNKLGGELYDKYDTFNKNWTKKKAEPKQPRPYWSEAKAAISLKDKEISKIKSIQTKYKKEINQIKKQKKWNVKERTRIERKRSAEIKKLLGKKYDKYEKFNADWRKKKK